MEIELIEVTKNYLLGEVEVRALRGVSLTIAAGEWVAVMGASGSGKSTLMNILGCLDRPTAGKYMLAGRDVTGLSGDELAEVRNRKIGFVFQNFNLLARTSALENVELPLLYRRGGGGDGASARELLEQVGLGGRLHHLPTQLSGGEQQRVAIARALINKPSLLLADEPTGNLDTASSGEIMDLFHKLHGSGLTIIMVTHEPDIAQHAQRAITVRDGRLA
jgi:ABC-type lipoprotein export system ATPase subunit